MKPKFKLFAISLLLLAFSSAYAQKDTTTSKSDTNPPKKSYLKIGVSYLNNNVFLGRVDTVTTPTVSHKISYTLKSGFYVSGQMDFITNRANNKLDGGNVELGYDYTEDDNLEWGASFTKLFFNSTSTQVASSLSSTANAYIDYDVADIITPGLSLSYSFVKGGGSGDLLLSPSISHDFLIESIFGDDDKLLISPQAGFNAGSQNFYSEYLVRKGKINRKGVNAAYTTYNNDLGNFALLDYELTAPIVYIAGNFSFSFTPTMAFAQDALPTNTAAEKLITDTIEKAQPFKSSVFYFEAGISFKF